MSKGSKLSRIIDYFKSAELEEVRYVYARAADILSERQRPVTEQLTLPTGPRRKRRTKAELAVAKQIAAQAAQNKAQAEVSSASMPMQEQEANAKAATAE